MKKHRIKLSLTSLASLMLILGLCIYLNAQDEGDFSFEDDEKDKEEVLDEKGLEKEGISLEEATEDDIAKIYGLEKATVKKASTETKVAAKPVTEAKSVVGEKETVVAVKEESKVVAEAKPVELLTRDEQHEKARREAHESNAAAEMLDAQAEWVDKNYEVALKKFEAAHSELNLASKLSPRVKSKQAQIRKVQAKINQEWAESLVVEAAAGHDAEMFDLAIKKLEKAIAHNPTIKDELLAKIKKYELDKAEHFYTGSIVSYNVDKDKAKRDLDIKILFEQGKLLKQNLRLDESKAKFEQILRINPFDAKTIAELRKIQRIQAKIGDERRKNTVIERIGAVRWTWTDPLPKLRTKKATTAKGPAVVKVEDVAMKKMDRKLNQIIIPKIRFTQTPIHNVIEWLRQESKKRDNIYSEGINFMLVGSSGEPVVEDAEFEDDEVDEWTQDEDEDLEEDMADAPAGGTKVSIILEQVTLGEAIRFICSTSNLKFLVEPNGVLITSGPGVQLPVREQFETRYFSVKPSFFRGVIGLGRASNRGSIDNGFGEVEEMDDTEEMDPVEAVKKLRMALTQLGIDFTLKDRDGDNAAVHYQQAISRLIITHSPESLMKIQEFVDLYNKGARQVSIQAKFVEITQTDIEELGFQWMLTQGSHHGTTPFGSDFVLPGTASSPQNITNAVRFMNSITQTGLIEGVGEMLTLNTVIGNLEFQNVVNAISQKGNTDVLSAPKVTTLSGQTATIKRVQERYFPEGWTDPEAANSGSGDSSSSSNGMKPSIPEYGDITEIGVILSVTPTVMPGSTEIELDLQPKVRDFVGYDEEIKIRLGVDEDGIPIYHIPKMPIIDLRAVETVVICDDGETVVLGGLITERVRSISDKVPFFGDVPLVGRLFRNEAEFSEKFNLLIFVTARMVDSSGRTIINHRVDGFTDGKPEYNRY